MAARAPRRSFAAPFVVTLAATIPAAACVVQSRPAPQAASGSEVRDHRGAGPSAAESATPTNPPRPTGPEAEPSPAPPTTAPPATYTNPPRPTGSQVEPSPAPPTTATPPAGPGASRPPVATTATAGVAPATSPAPTVVANPPRPTVVTQPDRRWTIMMTGGSCKAYVEVTCPADATCNPPPPRATKCLPGMASGASVKVVQRAGQAECWTEPESPSCPPGTRCNPPRPQKVACPK